MAIASFSTNYENLDQLPAYQPCLITCTANATGVEAVRMQVFEKAAPSGSFTQVSQMVRQADLSTTDQFTFNLCAIAQDNLSCADTPIAYGYPNGVTTNEWKQYYFLFDELSRNANDQLVNTDNDKGWDGATGVTEENYGELGIHYASWHSQDNQYYLGNINNNLVDVIGSHFGTGASPIHDGTASRGRFLTDLTGIVISEPWSYTLDYMVEDGVTNLKASYRHTFNQVVYDRTKNLTAATDAVERQRLRCGLKDLEDNSDFGIVSNIMQGYNAGDDDGYQIFLRSGTTNMTLPRFDVKMIQIDGCRKVGLEWVNPYGAVDFMEFRMKGDDLFSSEGELWEKSEYADFVDVYASNKAVNYPQALQRQRKGRYTLELESHPLPIDYGHLVLKQMMLAPKAWIQVQMDKGGFASNDESFTQSNITDRIQVLLEFDEEEVLVNRKGDGTFTISVRATFSRKQQAQRN
jgi:hypothetical protein